MHSLPRRLSLPAILFLVAATAACKSTPQDAAASAYGPKVFSEQEVLAGYPGHVAPGDQVLLQLEAASASPSPTTDTGTSGVDVLPVRIPEAVSFRLCFQSPRAHQLSLKTTGGVTLASVTASPDPTCQGNLVSLQAGDYTLEARHADGDGTTYPVLIGVTNDSISAALSPALGAATAPTTTVTAKDVPTYDPTLTYKPPAVGKPAVLVQWAGVIYELGWWANSYNCPVASVDLKNCVVTPNQWKVYDPEVKPEWAYYDYSTLVASYPNPTTCTKADYGTAAMVARVNASITSGDMSLAVTTTSPFTDAEKQALYREAMLPCLPPDLSLVADADLPPNVQVVKAVMPLATWKTFASKSATAEVNTLYDSDFTDTSKTYWLFLAAVARFPYFCGEVGGRPVSATDSTLVGAFPTIAEACKRELAALFAHAAQETGGGDPLNSFEYLREGGSYGNKNYQPGVSDPPCGAPFDCSNAWALYYGRGPKQVTHFYNYAGFSAARFVTSGTMKNFNYLLKWPDLVAYDTELYFLSGIWFMMANQPPKPSIHEIILHRYAPPSTKCTEATCGGLAYDATMGLTHPFTATIEIINGGIECRRGKDNIGPTHRSQSYSSVLTALQATLTPEEQDLPVGCASIIQYACPDLTAKCSGDTLFSWPALDPGFRTWVDLSTKTCLAQNYGGAATVSVTAPGIVAACKGP